MGGIRIASRLPGDKFAQVAQKSKPETPSRRRSPTRCCTGETCCGTG